MRPYVTPPGVVGYWRRDGSPSQRDGLNLDLGDAVILKLASYENMQGDTESTAPFALRIAGLSTGRTRFAGTLYAARQDDETVQALI